MSVLATYLGIFYQWIILVLHPLCLGEECTLSLSSSQDSPVLVAPSILPAWLLTNQCFIKPIQVTNLCRVQDHCTTAPKNLSHKVEGENQHPRLSSDLHVLAGTNSHLHLHEHAPPTYTERDRDRGTHRHIHIHTQGKRERDRHRHTHNETHIRGVDLCEGWIKSKSFLFFSLG